MSKSDNDYSGSDSDSDSDNVNDDFGQSHSQPLDPPTHSKNISSTPYYLIKKHLGSRIKPFLLSAKASKSTSTRRPRFFDLHLHPDLQLRKIVVVQDLPARIAAVCDKNLSSQYLVHLSSKAQFPFHGDGSDKGAAANRNTLSEATLVNERHLVNAYMSQVGKPISTLSSTLALGLDNWSTVFNFCLSVRDPPPLSNNAKPDGFLCVVDEGIKDPLNSFKFPIPGKHRHNIGMIIKHNLDRMVLWEFKSLSAGSYPTFQKFVDLEGDFLWLSCGEQGQACNHSYHAANGHLTKTGRKIGFDSRLPFIQALGAQVDGINAPDSGLGNVAGVDYIFASGSKDAHLSSSPSKGATIALSKCTAKKKQTIIEPVKFRGKRLKAAAASKKKSTKLTDPSPSQPPLSNSEPQKPRDMAQQLWAEGVKYDATFLVLNAGNHEIICVRDRDKQTLYISPILSLRNRIYKRTQLGLHMLGYEDAADRAHQAEGLESPLNQAQPPRFHALNFQFEVSFNRPKATTNPDITSNDSEAIYQELMYQLASEDRLMVMLPQALKKYDKGQFSICSWTSRATSSASAAGTSSRPPSKALWTLEFGKKISERVYSIKAENELGLSFPDKLVIKLSLNLLDLDHLKYEYECHTTFADEPFGVKVFGILCFPERYCMYGLLMEWSGEPLEGIKGRARFEKSNKKEYSEFAMAQLQALHALKSKKVHGNIKPGHVLFRDNGRVSFISFRKPCQSLEAEKEAELELIRDLLSSKKPE